VDAAVRLDVARERVDVVDFNFVSSRYSISRPRDLVAHRRQLFEHLDVRRRPPSWVRFCTGSFRPLEEGPFGAAASS